MKSRFFHKRITAIWEHVGNFGLQSPSIQLNYSNFWLSHITDHNFKMFSWLSDAFFLVCANLWIGIEKNIKIHHAPNWCFNACFLPFYKETNTIYSTIFVAPEHFFLAFPHATPTTHAPNRDVFRHLFVHQIVFFVYHFSCTISCCFLFFSCTISCCL